VSGPPPAPGQVGLRVTDRLDEPARAAVLALADEAAVQDGVAPLSEAFRLALAPPPPAPPDRRDAPAVAHVLAAAEGDLVGYAQRAPDGSAELVVAPAARRGGTGTTLLRRLVALGASRVWAHGDLPAARALAAAEGLTPVRSLHLLARPLTDADRAAPALPPGFRVRAFRPGADDDAWLAVNAAAFAEHPEQGAVTLADLRARQRQPWFDPEGLLLVEDLEADGGPRPVAFHWTKVDPPPPATAAAGEVYVLGVHPAYQGRGLARPLTRIGLASLARRGLPEVVLYVDGDNAAALATYRSEGFTDRSVDVMYAVPRADAAG
jgi:mycothiol synthase